jgi:cysteinyl-tRNA synthetase
MEAISGKSPMAKYWMHGGFLTVNGQKMGKSLGNFITINDLLRRCPVNYLRFFIVKNLWSSPVDYSESVMIEVKSAVNKIEEFLGKLKAIKSVKSSKEVDVETKNLKGNFYKELDDDFNTPKAFAVMFDFINKANILLNKNLISKKQAGETYKFFQDINEIFGIINFKKVNKTIPSAIKKLAKERELHRQNKDWQKADQVRAQIESQGFSVQDSENGPVIKSI